MNFIKRLNEAWAVLTGKANAISGGKFFDWVLEEWVEFRVTPRGYFNLRIGARDMDINFEGKKIGSGSGFCCEPPPIEYLEARKNNFKDSKIPIPDINTQLRLIGRVGRG